MVESWLSYFYGFFLEMDRIKFIEIIVKIWYEK